MVLEPQGLRLVVTVTLQISAPTDDQTENWPSIAAEALQSKLNEDMPEGDVYRVTPVAMLSKVHEYEGEEDV